MNERTQRMPCGSTLVRYRATRRVCGFKSRTSGNRSPVSQDTSLTNTCRCRRSGFHGEIDDRRCPTVHDECRCDYSFNQLQVAGSSPASSACRFARGCSSAVEQENVSSIFVVVDRQAPRWCIRMKPATRRPLANAGGTTCNDQVAGSTPAVVGTRKRLTP